MLARCKKCGRDIPAGKLSCLHCLGHRNAEARRRYQLDPVLQVAQGKGAFTIHKGGHAQLFGPFSGRAFCGGKVAARDKRSLVDYGTDAYRRLCPKCREAIEETLVEAREAQAIREEA